MAVRVRWLVPAMATMLSAYAATHSPLLQVVARAARGAADGCGLLCSPWIPYGRPFDAGAALLCLLLAGCAAWVAARRLDLCAPERGLVFGLLALGLVVVPAAWVGMLGWALGYPSLRPPLGPLLTGLPAVLLLAAGTRRERRGSPSSFGMPPLPMIAWLVAAVAVLLLGSSTLISLAHPPAGYDALSYHAPLAVYYWRDGDLASYLERQPTAWALAHPGSAELLFGLLRVAAGERVANLGQLPFALLGAMAVYLLARRTRLPPGPSALGGLAFLTAPIVVVQSGMQLNDLASGALLLAGLALAAAPRDKWAGPRLPAIGFALALAVTTKLAAVPAAGAVILYLLLRWGGVGRPGERIGVAALSFLIVVAPWWFRNVALFGNPLYPAALPILGRGFVVGEFVRKDDWFVPGPLAWPLYPLIESHDEMSGFGALFLVGALPGLLIALGRGRRAPLTLIAMVGIVSAVAWWQMTQHEPRLLLGVVAASFACLGWTLAAVPRAQRRAASLVLAAAAVVSAGFTLAQALWPLARADHSRATFYELEWGIDSLVAGLPEREGLLYHTGYAYRSYAGDYPLLGPTQGRTITVVDGELSTDSIVRTMQTQGFRYAYVPADSAARDTVERMYPAARFELVHASDLASVRRWRDTRRYLFRLREGRRP